MNQDLKALQLSWPAKQKTIRADIINNKQALFMLIKLVICLFSICYVTKMLPSASIIQQYTPYKWQRVDILDLHSVNPLNRNIKVYVAPANNSQQIDLIHEVDVYTLVDNQQKQKRLSVNIMELDKFTDISDNTLRFYLGDVHVLDEVAYRIKISKPMKLKRVLQQNIQQLTQISNQTKAQHNSTLQIRNQTKVIPLIEQQQNNSTFVNQTQTNSSNYINQTDSAHTTNMTKQEMERVQEQRKREQEEQKQKQEENRKKKQKEQRIRKEQQQKKRIEEEQNKRKQEQERKKRQEQERIQKQQQQRIRKIFQHTNIRLQAHMVSSFATILQLIVRYISILIIIYMAADNHDAPKAIAIICTLTSNPLLFLQISYPNQISDIIEGFCRSAPLLYLSLWMYYIHKKIIYNKQIEYKVFLGIKLTLGIVLYFLNVLRLLHFQVVIWQTFIIVAIILWVGIYLWDAFLNLQYQHHRDKILAAVTLTYLGSLFTFKILSGPWQDIMIYVIVQLYGLNIMYLTASQKIKKNKKQKIKSIGQIQGQLQNEQIKQQIQLVNKN